MFNRLKHKILHFAFSKISPFPMYPYSFAKEYLESKNGVIVGKLPQLTVNELDKYYVASHNGIEIYFPRFLYGKQIDKDFVMFEMSLAACEMDLRSPHRYVTKENKLWGTLESEEISSESGFCVEKGDIVADIGASHGNFSISVVDIAKHIYLFESDSAWNEPLLKTFEKYKDKVTIINKYASDVDNENSIKLDTFFKDKEVNFIKADVEGHEMQMLNGAKELLKNRNNIKCSITTYHKPEDKFAIKKFFDYLGYSSYFTKGYLFLWELRKGLLRARKEN